MKKRVIASFIGFAMVTVIIGTCVSKVSADQGTEVSVETDAGVTEEMSEETVIDTEAETESADEDIISEETEDNLEQSEDAEVTAESETAEEAEEVSGMKVMLENALEADVVSVKISTFTGEVFTDNLLIKDTVLKAGDSCTIGIPDEFQDKELGMYNVRITLSDGSETEIPFVPFLENVKGTLYRQNDIVLIQIRDPRLEAEAEVMSEAEVMQQEAEASEIMAEALVEEIE